MTGEYKEIKTVFGDDDEQPATRHEDSDLALQDGDTLQNTQPNADDVAREQKRKNRAKDRIKQLVNQRDTYADQLAAREKEIEDLRKKLAEGNQAQTTTLKSALENQYQVLSREMMEAIKNGDAERVVQCQEALFDVKLQLSKLAQEVSKPAPVQAESPRQAERQTIPAAAQVWIEEHPEFNTDELFHNSAITINNQLLRQGMDAESDEFYDELTKRLSKRFPEVFGVNTENEVELSRESTEGDSPVVKPARPQARAPEQTVSGSSRPSANTIRSRKSGNSDFALTAAEIAQADAWGLSQDRLKQRVQHMETNRRDDGYTTIIIPRK